MKIDFQIGHVLLTLACISVLAGCSPLVKMAVPTEHVVMFDKDGQPLNPTGNFWFSGLSNPGKDSIEKYHTDLAYSYPQENYSEYEQHTDRIINKMLEFNRDKSVKKIMFFIHGGLNTQVGSIKRLIEDPKLAQICNSESKLECEPRYERIKEAGYFPIFINWKSSLIASYGENLFFLRQGKNKPYLGILTSPFVFATDIGRSLLRWPIVASNLLINDVGTMPFSSENTEYSGHIAKELLCRYQYPYEDRDKIPANYKNKWSYEECLDETNGLKFSEAPWPCPFPWKGSKGNNDQQTAVPPKSKTFAISVGNDSRTCSELVFNFAVYIPTLPFKLLTMPIVDTFGTGSWDVMLRHVDLLFHTERELRKSSITDMARQNNSLATIPKHGGLSLLLQKLAAEIKADGTDKWEVTLVGHSMGAIVTNQLIRNYGKNLPIKNIIYLAAAATVHDYEDTIYPYLSEDDKRHIYHFMLHPRAEEGESMGVEFASRGSLLIWIDNFLSKPLSPMDRTVGRYDNLIPALHNADTSIRKQISLRVYNAGDGTKNTDPQTHSDVAARFKFWDKECWKPYTQKNCTFPIQK